MPSLHGGFTMSLLIPGFVCIRSLCRCVIWPQALNIPIDVDVGVDMCDPDESSYLYCMSEHRKNIRCFWKTLHDAEMGRTCRIHEKDRLRSGCSLQASVRKDILCICTPCQPFSKARFGHTKCTDHPLYDVVFGDEGSAISHARLLKPRVLIVEEVANFNGQFSDMDHTPLSAFMSAIMSITGPDGLGHFGGHTAIHLDSLTWVTAARPRTSHKTRDSRHNVFHIFGTMWDA